MRPGMQPEPFAELISYYLTHLIDRHGVYGGTECGPPAPAFAGVEV